MDLGVVGAVILLVVLVVAVLAVTSGRGRVEVWLSSGGLVRAADGAAVDVLLALAADAEGEGDQASADWLRAAADHAADRELRHGVADGHSGT